MKIFFKIVMAVTWLACAGFAILFVMASIPLALIGASFPQGEPFTPGWVIITSIIGGAVVLVAGFIAFAIGWPRWMGSRAYRTTTLLLLLLPLSAALLVALDWKARFGNTQLAAGIVVFTAWLMCLCLKPTLLYVNNTDA